MKFTIVIVACLVFFLNTPLQAAIPSKADSSVTTENSTLNEVSRAAIVEFKSLSKKERRERIKATKKELKQYKADKKAGKDTSDENILLIILAVLLPPLAVYLNQKEINNKFWISLLLSLIFWIPGVIYALLIIFDKI